jgi:hypothetical protein
MKTGILFVISFCILIISGCKDDSTSIINEYNNVNIRSVNDTLAISISTTNHNYSNNNIELVFSVDTVNLSMSVSGYGSGSGFFKVLHDTNTVISKDLGSNFQSSERLYTGAPTKAILNLTNYKGNASILLTK